MTDSYRCDNCGAVSHNPTDIAERYCGQCHQWEDILTVQIAVLAEMARLDELARVQRTIATLQVREQQLHEMSGRRLFA